MTVRQLEGLPGSTECSNTSACEEGRPAKPADSGPADKAQPKSRWPIKEANSANAYLSTIAVGYSHEVQVQLIINSDKSPTGAGGVACLELNIGYSSLMTENR